MTQLNSTHRPWFASGWVILVAALLFPPLGLVLLWMKPQTGIFKKLAGTLAIAVLGVAHLFLLYGMRVDVDGTGMRPIFTFHDPKKDIERLEKHRTEQQAKAAVNEPAAAQPTEKEKAISAEDVGKPGGRRAETASATVAVAAVLPGAYWTDFRGPKRDGIYAEMPVMDSWPDGELKPLWRQPVGVGYSSFAIAQGRAYTIEQRRDKEVVAAYDLETGRELWTDSWSAHFKETTGDGPRATPTWHEGRLYTLGAEGEFRCLDAATGKVIWRKDILEDNNTQNLQWGMAASPLVVDDKVIVLPGGRGASVVAYNKLTGDVIWKSQNDKQAYTAPMLATLAGQRQLVVVSAERVMGMTVEEGKLLWEHPWTTSYDVNAAQPIVVDGDHVLVSAGYDHGASLLRIQRDGEKFQAQPVWTKNTMKNKFSASVLRDGYLYGLDEAILACIDVKTGERKWKGGRYGYGQVLLAGGNLIVITEEGDLALVRATPEKHEELAKFSAIEGKTWNVPAIGNGILIVRNAREMAAYRISK